jgi:hypothetical protein
VPHETLGRAQDDLTALVKAHAADRGRSVNGWIVAVLRAAVDPELADTETERTRARLAKAGLLVTPAGASGRPGPDPERLAEARRAAGTGESLSRLVTDGRG